jgi:antitoxin (DNA-binding transcriptional repressor) of toxin-antitoxin stability system
MKHLSAAETEDRLWEVLIDVAAGESVIITDNETGEPIAKLEPCGKPFDLLSYRAMN